MTGISRLMASAAFVGLAFLGLPESVRADGPGTPSESAGHAATQTTGTIQGVVLDESGVPVVGALVSALGTTAVVAMTDRNGRFELRPLAPGAYLLRAHSTGFTASHGQMIDVRPSSRRSSIISLRRTTPSPVNSPTHTPRATVVPAPVLQAGVGLPGLPPATAAPSSLPLVDSPPPATEEVSASDDDHSEFAWHLRHLRRSVLQDTTGVTLDPDDASGAGSDGSGATTRFSRVDASPLRLAANLFSGAPISGELNFLTTSSFDTPQQLFSGEMSSRNIANMSVGAPPGSNADWAVRGALSQADISAWVIAGSYANRGPARHHYDVGLSYATQRYDGGNPAALRDVTDGSRNAGALYGFDTWSISPAVALTYGARYARYDYLETKGLVSPRISMTLSAGDHLRLVTSASRRAVAPGAEEFLPPGDAGIWLPPQRTFSSFTNGGPLDAERTTHLELGVERDLGSTSAVTFRAFQQYVEDQLLTMFDVDFPGVPPANLGHYFVGNFGDVEARGITTGFRTVAGRVRGSVEYSTTSAQWNAGGSLNYWELRIPGVPSRPDRLHSVSTSIQAEVPETATRVVVLYRISNASARLNAQDDRSLDSRFDVEVHQSLPFMDFSTAKWEMLIGVRNFFRETANDQSVFDELLVVRPPKRIVGGLTMRF